MGGVDICTYDLLPRVYCMKLMDEPPPRTFANVSDEGLLFKFFNGGLL
jgi:hypothetical protein